MAFDLTQLMALFSSGPTDGMVTSLASQMDPGVAATIGGGSGAATGQGFKLPQQNDIGSALVGDNVPTPNQGLVAPQPEAPGVGVPAKKPMDMSKLLASMGALQQPAAQQQLARPAPVVTGARPAVSAPVSGVHNGPGYKPVSLGQLLRG